MSKETYKHNLHKRRTIKIAKELCYDETVIETLKKAKTEGEIERIMIKARHNMR